MELFSRMEKMTNHHKEWHKRKHEKHKRLFTYIAVVSVLAAVAGVVFILSGEKKYFREAVNCNEDYESKFEINKLLNNLNALLENSYTHERETRETFHTTIVERVKNIDWHDAEITAQISLTLPEELAGHLEDKALKLSPTKSGMTFIFEHKFKAQEEKAFEYSFDKKLAKKEIKSIIFSISGHSQLPFTMEKRKKELTQGLMENNSMRCINRALLNCEKALMQIDGQKIEIRGKINGTICSADYYTYGEDQKRYSCKIPFKAYPGKWNAEEVLRFCVRES